MSRVRVPRLTKGLLVRCTGSPVTAGRTSDSVLSVELKLSRAWASRRGSRQTIRARLEFAHPLPSRQVNAREGDFA